MRSRLVVLLVSIVVLLLGLVGTAQAAPVAGAATHGSSVKPYENYGTCWGEHVDLINHNKDVHVWMEGAAARAQLEHGEGTVNVGLYDKNNNYLGGTIDANVGTPGFSLVYRGYGGKAKVVTVTIRSVDALPHTVCSNRFPLP